MNIVEELRDRTIVAVVRAPDPTSALAGAAALVRGGVSVIEVTYSTPEAPTVIARLRERLGAFPLPIEVLPFGWVSTRRLITELLWDAGYEDVAIQQRMRNGNVVVTDSGNYLLDARLRAIEDVGSIAIRLNEIPGVVNNGLFVGIAGEVVVGHPDGTAEIIGLPFPESDG